MGYHQVTDFPTSFPLEFNYTRGVVPPELLMTRRALEVKVLKHNAVVELVFQGTSLLGGTDHPMRLHGHSFYVVGWGFGNFDERKDPLNYNLVDPPLRQTIAVPRNGWTAARFQANNPGKYVKRSFLHKVKWNNVTYFCVFNFSFLLWIKQECGWCTAIWSVTWVRGIGMVFIVRNGKRSEASSSSGHATLLKVW